MISAADKREGIAGEELELLLDAVFVNAEVLCSRPSTSLPSSSFTVTGTVTKLTVRCSRNNSSRPLSPALEALPAGTVLIPCEPGGGAWGLVCSEVAGSRASICRRFRVST